MGGNEKEGGVPLSVLLILVRLPRFLAGPGGGVGRSGFIGWNDESS